MDFLLHPGCTFFGNSLLLQFISQTYFEFCPVEAFLALQSRDIKFPAFFRRLFCNKSRRGKNKPEFITTFQFLFQCLVGVDGKTGRSHRKLAARFYFLSQVIPDDFRCVIERFHMIYSRYLLYLPFSSKYSLYDFLNYTFLS